MRDKMREWVLSGQVTGKEERIAHISVAERE
jgi:hypothetical protein